MRVRSPYNIGPRFQHARVHEESIKGEVSVALSETSKQPPGYAVSVTTYSGVYQTVDG